MTAAPAARVLIVGINYAPEHTGIAPYTTAAAEHLAAQGLQVTMCTGVPHYPGWSVPAGYRWCIRREEQVNGVRVRRFRHFVPRSQNSLKRGLYELSFAAQVWARTGGAQADVVIAVVPSLFSAVVAARVARLRGATFIVWLQDSMGAAARQSGMPGGRSVAQAVSRVEQLVIRQAHTVIVVSEAFRGYVESVGTDPQQVITLPNWVQITPPTKPPELTRRERGWGKDEVIVLHSGNIGLKQGLAAVVEAAELARGVAPAVRFVILGDGSQRAELEERARHVPNVAVLGPVSDEDYSNVLSAADILLVNERVGVVDMSLPSKLTSYFAAGRPVVASVSPAGGTAAEVRRSGAGLVTETHTPAAMLAAILALTHDPERANELGLRGQRYADAHLSGRSSLARLSEVVLPSRPHASLQTEG